jgi:hypothetical protein
MDKDPGRSKEPLLDREARDDRTVFTHYRGGGVHYSPRPGRNYDKRHFELQERVGAILMFTILAVVLLWLAIDFRLLPDIFGWYSGPAD